MSLLSSFRTRPPRPPTPRAVAPAAAMEVGGLQLECAVCSYDLFHRRQLILLDGSRGAANGEAGWFYLAMSAVSCDRCGAVQLFDPAARSDPDAPIPARRVGRLRHREEPPEESTEEAATEEVAEMWTGHDEERLADDGAPAELVDGQGGGDPGPEAVAAEPPAPSLWPDASPAAEPPEAVEGERPQPTPSVGDETLTPPTSSQEPPAPVWPEPLPPLPPLLPLPRPPEPDGGSFGSR